MQKLQRRLVCSKLDCAQALSDLQPVIPAGRRLQIKVQLVEDQHSKSHSQVVEHSQWISRKVFLVEKSASFLLSQSGRSHDTHEIVVQRLLVGVHIRPRLAWSTIGACQVGCCYSSGTHLQGIDLRLFYHLHSPDMFKQVMALEHISSKPNSRQVGKQSTE